jgi:hypothetical protein
MTSTSVASKQSFALFLLVLLLYDARVPGGDHVKAHLPWRHYIAAQVPVQDTGLAQRDAAVVKHILLVDVSACCCHDTAANLIITYDPADFSILSVCWQVMERFMLRCSKLIH